MLYKEEFATDAVNYVTFPKKHAYVTRKIKFINGTDRNSKLISVEKIYSNDDINIVIFDSVKLNDNADSDNYVIRTSNSYIYFENIIENEFVIIPTFTYINTGYSFITNVTFKKTSYSNTSFTINPTVTLRDYNNPLFVYGDINIKISYIHPGTTVGGGGD